MTIQNPNNAKRKNNRSNSSNKSMQKAARARDNRWNKKEEHTQSNVEKYKDPDEHDLDVLRKITHWSECNGNL